MSYGKINGEKMKSIHCPYCNMRLFDAKEVDKASIEIKCVRCGKIVRIELKGNLQQQKVS